MHYCKETSNNFAQRLSDAMPQLNITQGVTHMPNSYFDFNATSPVRPEVIDAMNRAMVDPGNASSVHSYGRGARALVDDARANVAKLVGAKPEWVIFCGSGTEADNQVLRCCPAETVLISGFDHDAVRFARTDSRKIQVTINGLVDLDALDKALNQASGLTLISVMAANNETGVVQPLEEINLLAKRYGALLHTDAIQAAGKIEVDMMSLGADFLSLSAHKIGGPQGVGALIVRDKSLLTRFVHGGGQEYALRAGTENVPGIAGFGVAAVCAQNELDSFSRLARWRDDLESRLLAIDNSITIFGRSERRLPNTSKLATPGFSAEVQVLGMDLAGYAISSGSACSAGRVDPPFVLTEMGVADELASCAIRISLGWTTKEREISGFVDAWSNLYSRNRERISKNTA